MQREAHQYNHSAWKTAPRDRQPTTKILLPTTKHIERTSGWARKVERRKGLYQTQSRHLHWSLQASKPRTNQRLRRYLYGGWWLSIARLNGWRPDISKARHYWVQIVTAVWANVWYFSPATLTGSGSCQYRERYGAADRNESGIWEPLWNGIQAQLAKPERLGSNREIEELEWAEGRVLTKVGSAVWLTIYQCSKTGQVDVEVFQLLRTPVDLVLLYSVWHRQGTQPRPCHCNTRVWASSTGITP